MAEYTTNDVRDMRKFLIEKRNKCLGPDIFDAEGAVVYSHIIAVLYELIEAQDD